MKCRVDGDVSDANTKVYGGGHAPFPSLFVLFSSLLLGLRQASEKMEGAMKTKNKKQMRRFTPYSVGQVHDPFLFFDAPVKFLSTVLERFHRL